MKLHLPKGLRAALIAAFAVAGTLAQAGITMTDITQWDGYDATSGVAHVGNSGGTIYNAKQQQPDYKWNNHWNFVFTVDASTLTEGTYSLDTLALTQNKVEGYIVASSLVMDGSGNGTVTHGGWNQAGATAGVDLSSAKDITFVLSRNNNGGIVSLTGYVDGNFDTAAFTLSVNTNLSFSGESYVSTVSYGSTGGLTAFNHGNNTYRQVADTSVGTFDITKAGYLLGSQVTTADLVKYYTPPSILEWRGTSSATWDLSTPNWVAQGETTPTVFVDYATAVFGSGATLVKDIEVDGPVNVDVMNVQADYTFTAGSGSSLMVDTLNVAAGKTATLAGEGYFSVSHLAGAVSIASGASLTVGGTITLSGTQTLPVKGEGKLVATTLQVTGGDHTITNALEVTGGGDGTGGTNRSLGLAVTNAAATVTLAGATNITGALYAQVGTVNIGNGTDAVRVETNRVEFGDTGGTGTSTLNVNKDATLHVKAGDVANNYSSTGLIFGEWGGVSVANIAGKLYAQNATAYVGDNLVTFNIQADGLMAVQGFAQNQTKDKTETINLNLLDGGTLVMGANGITNQKPVNINFAAGEVGISDYNVEIAKDVTVSGSGTTFNTNVYEWTGSDETLELQEGSGGGTLTISGNITGDGTIILEGDGTLALSGANNVLTHTISANSGNLTLSGGYDISDIASEGETSYAGGQRAGNGYATANGTITVYSGPATVDDSQAAYIYHGEDVTVTVAGGVYTLPGTQDDTTYFINAGTDSYNWIDTNKPGELTGGIVVKEGATLQADKDMDMSVVAASSKGTVQIEEGVVVSSNGGSQHVALTGKGTYALTSGAQTLGSVDASGLEGWVRLTGGMININLDDNLQGKNVELSGVSGYFKNVNADSQAVFNGNLRLSDVNGTPAITVTDGFSRDRAYLVFSGAVSGNGKWELKCGATQHYVFSGDISAWDGTFHVTNSGLNNGGTSINFKDAATTVNATIALDGGTLRLFADTDVTFNAAVTGTTSTTVAAGKTMTFATNEDSSIGGISGAGTLDKNGTGTLTVSGAPYIGTTDNPIPATVTINVNAGTLKATTAGTLGGGAVNVASGATLEMTTGDILGGTQTVTNSGNVLLHQTFTKGIINGGTLTLASDFPTAGDMLDVDDKTTGNGFSQGGAIKVYDPEEATLTVDEIKHGDNTYHMADLVQGTITLSGADWSTYQYNIATLTPPTVQEIIDFADTKSGTTGALSTISVNADGLYLVDDSTALKTSMLGGEHLDSFQLLLDDGASLLLDEDFAGSIQLGITPESAATLVLDKDVSVGDIMAYDDGFISTLTVTGAHTLSTATAATSEAAIVLESGAHLAVTELGGLAPDKGDTVTVKDTAELSMPNVSIKSVNGSDAAVLSNVNSDDAYSLASADHSLANARVTVNSAVESTFGNAVSGSIALVNAGTGVLTDATDNTAYTELAAQGGNIVLGAKAATVGNLTVGDGRGISVAGTGSITVNGIADLGSGATVSSALTMAAGSTLDGTAALGNHALSLDGGINISADLWSTISALDPEATTTIFTGVSALTLNGTQYSEDVDLKDIFNHASLKPNKYMLGYKDGNVVITKNLENNRYWKGGSGSWNTTATNLWTDEEGGADAAFVNGYNAHFTSASGGVITLGADITADSITVSGADYIFSPGTYSLTVNKSVEADAHKATFNMTLSGENLKLIAKNGGAITLAKGGSVKDVEIGSGSSLEVSSATLTVADGFVNNGMLDAETLILSQGTAQGGNVNAGTLNLASGQSYTFGKLNAATISGTGADLTIGDGGTLSATATLKSLTTGDSAQLGGNITVAGATNAGGGTTISGSLTTATLTGGPILVADGDLTLTSNGSLGGVQVSGTSSLTASGTTTVTLGASLVNSDALTLKGRFDASNLGTSKSDSKYVEGGTPGNGNGFEQARLTLTIVNGGTTSANDATIVYRTKTLTEKVGTNGKVTFDGDVDYTKFYVNSGTENASTAMNNAKWTETSSFVLNSNTTLVVDHEDISLGMVNMPAGAALLQIESGYTVATDGSSKNLMLTGAGELAVDAGKATPGVVYHATEWTGTVSLRDVELTQLDSDWGTANSTVALQNASGALGNAEVKYDLELRKGAGDSWGYGGTSSTKDSHLWLKGDLKGDGDLGVKSGTATSVFELNGNTDAWTGNFIVATNANTTLKLTGSDKVVNGTVNGSNLALVVETNATLKSDSTVARVNATAGSLKVDAGKTLTVTDTILPNNIKLGAGASIAAAFMGGTEYGYMDGIIANKTGGDQAVSINNADITVTGATLCTNGGTGFTVDNKLVDAKLLVAETLTKAVALNNVQDSLEVVDDLAIGAGGSLKVANGGAKQELVIGSGTTLTLADGTTLDANVAIGSGATLTLNYNTAGTPVATTLNSGSLSLANGLTLSGNVYNQLAAFTDADDNKVVDLFQGVGALTLGGSAYSEEVKASQYFTNLGSLSDLGDFTLLYNDSTDTVSIRFNLSEARTLTWNGTEGNSTWQMGEGTATNWLDATQQDTHFASGDTAKFTGDAAYKEVTIAATTTEARDVIVSGEEAQYGFVVNDGTSKLVVDNQMKVADGAALAKKGEGDLMLDLNAALTVDGATLAVEDGTLYVGTPAKNGTLDLKNAAVNIAQGATLSANTITGDADTTIAMDGTLHVGGGSIQGLTAGENSKLAINLGTLTIATDTTLYGLTSSGTLDLGTRELTLADATEHGGNVTAGTLNFSEYGSNFGDLKVNTIHYAYDMEGAGTIDYVEVDTIAANGAGKITLDMTDVRGNGGSLAPIQRTGGEITYTLVHATGQALDAAGFTLDAATLEALVQNGLIREGAGLVVSEDNASLQLTIGGLGQDLTWYTSKDTTEWGYTVMNGDEIAHGANTLNGVQHVVVDEDRTIDVTSVADDAVLRVRNITGAANKTITFTGEHSDAVALIATEDTSSDVNVAAEHILLGVGLPETDDIDPIEYDADLHVGSVKLTDALLVVTNAASFSVDRLNGDEDSMISGAVAIEGQGGAYRGEYAGAAITVVEDAEATLYAGETLKLYGEGTVKLMYTKSTEIDGVNADGMTLILNNPRASIIGTTLTMQDESGLTNGTLVFGMSAIESAKRIDSIQTPQIIAGSLVLGDGTTVVVNQDDLADSGIAMAVNNHGVYRNLALAYIGNEETDTKNVQLNGYLYGKYYKNARIEAGELLVDMRDDFYKDLTKATSENGLAGAGMLDDALLYENPQVTSPDGDLAAVMNALETGAIPQRSADQVAAAMSGASHAALGAAWSHDVDRQLRAIRNRTTQMGMADCVVNEDLPYFNAWINAEGDYGKMNADSTLAGYKLSSWGGTLGVDVDLTPRFTFGAAVTAMSGDFTADSAETAEGDLDRMYVTVFGRYSHRAWSHTLVATYGMADTNLKRTVNYGPGSYTAESDSDGSAFGIMYEVGYAAALNEDASTCLQPVLNLSYRHSSLDGSREKSGSDAALKLGDAEANVFTVALGARLQSTVGTSVYNRATLFEGRVLCKVDSGDRDVAAGNGFTGIGHSRDAKSAEMGLFGVEVGAGITIPVAERGGALFLDVTGEFRAKYTEINGTVGYRFNF